MPPTKRRAYIAGNWKMHKDLREARSLAEDIARGLPSGPRVGLFPNAIALAPVVDVVRESKKQMIVGAQTIHWEEQGAFTGEIAASMVVASGAEAVLVGHSERRHVFGETDDEVGAKVAASLQSKLEPVLCVGEKLEEREAGTTKSVVSRQLHAGLERLSEAADLARVVIAYEPVWAIGTGKTATPAQGEEVHALLRNEMREAFRTRGGTGDEAEETLILYGGSVKPDNAGSLLAEEDIDGLLVGGASLDADSFLAICKAAA